MIKISKRLETIANYIEDNSKVIDIGCDHGLLDIYLALHKKNINVIASDIREKALERAKSNIKKYRVEDKIDLRMGDGLKVLDNDQVDTIIIAGLGGDKIINIFYNSRKKLKGITNIIIQSNTKISKLRYLICRLGYYIEDEKLILENNKIYTIIYFKKGKKKYRLADFLLGPILRKNKDSLYLTLIKKEINEYKKIYHSIPKKYFIKRYKIKNYLNLLQKEL